MSYNRTGAINKLFLPAIFLILVFILVVLLWNVFISVISNYLTTIKKGTEDLSKAPQELLGSPNKTVIILEGLLEIAIDDNLEHFYYINNAEQRYELIFTHGKPSDLASGRKIRVIGNFDESVATKFNVINFQIFY